MTTSSILSVTDFGAVGDGVTDDSAAIADTYAAAAANDQRISAINTPATIAV